MGIWGMGGSGKTTTAKAIYNQIYHTFLYHHFIANIRQVCERGDEGIIHLQEQLLANVLGFNEKIYNTASGITTIEDRLSGIKALIVLDDVSTLEQAEALCGNSKWFGSGSVLIVTSRDTRILRLLEVKYRLTMKEMVEGKSLELFCWHAFRQPSPIEDFSELSRSVVAYCGGLPLALEIIGSMLHYRTKQEWRSVLSKFEKIPHYLMQQILKISYDGLMDDMVKAVFLDICCFFIGEDKAYVTEILNGCGLCADIGIAVLIERSLLKVEDNNTLGMHKLIRDMGREIVRESSAKEPGERSRLWFHDDIHDVLTENTGRKNVEGLVLKSQRTGRVCFSTESFKRMKDLRLLKLDRVDLTGDYGYLSKELRWVHWKGFTFNYIPDDFHQGNLVVFELTHSNIKHVWNETKVLVNLKILNLSHSIYLESSPDFSKLPNLEKLIMNDCPCLSEIHPSIGDLNNIHLINLKNCISLSKFPKNIFKLKSLKTLILLGCTKIGSLEKDIVQMESLTELITNNTLVKEVVFSKHRSVSVHCQSEIHLKEVLRRFLEGLYGAGLTKIGTSHASQISDLSLRSLLIGIGKSISQGLTTNDSGDFSLPGDNYPSWLAYTGEGSSVNFQVPEDSDCCLKGITLCVVYSSTPENMVAECLNGVLITNYTKCTIQAYKRDTLSSFNDEDWQGVVSNLGVGDKVEIIVVFGDGLIVKKTTVYLIYDQSITIEVDTDEKDALKNDVDAKSKGGPSRCDNQRDVDEACKRHKEILNQSEDADYKEALVNGVDVNKRMAEQIPYAVAESLFNRLTSAAFRELGQVFGVMDELERLKNSVECVRVVLLDAQDKQEQNFVVQNWIRRLTDVLHLADDLLDEFIIEGMRYKVDAGDNNRVTWIHSSSSSNYFLHQKMAPEIEKVQKKFDVVLEQMSKLNLSSKVPVVKQTDSLRNKSISFLLESNIMGREDDKKEIINLLTQPHGNISSIVIVGIGGIGKTTLARFVYNDVEVQKHFEKKMWVCVSSNFDVKTIVKKMLESLIDRKIDDKLSFEYIQQKLHENLTGERYLLVLDDICNASHEKWTQLRTYLMCGAEDSKVLMTRRSAVVSERLEASELYVLSGLTLDVSWSMLKKIIFGKELSVVNLQLESIGIKIAEKCMGVPLAIRTLGGLLQRKSEEREWIDVLQGDFWELCEDKESISSILKFSYQSLSLQLRQCFAYCSLYPKDWEIEKDALIQLWMAQGYLECTDEKQLMEDAGNEFVKILLIKSFFQDAKVGGDGDIVSFKMHNLMHDLAMKVAGNDCCYLDSEAERCVQKPMHVSLKPSAVHLLDSLDASRLQTLIFLSSNEEEELNGVELSVILNFEHLRVLKLSYCCLTKLSGSIGKLKHLRYLNLSHCRRLGSLHKSISSLVFLQTLILAPNEKVEFSTLVVSKLINLRNLHISDWEASRDETPSEFVNLSVWQYEGMVFSNWLSPLTNIVKISFFLCGSLQYLPPLERLPFLKSLHISFLEELEYIYYEQDFTSAFFPSLESLSLQFCYKLKGWWRIGDDFNNCSQNLSLPPFPRLCQLSIIGCLMLTFMPTFPNLENGLELYNSRAETLIATLNTAAVERMNDFPPLSMLKSLHIDGVRLDVKSIPNVWMKNLTSLQLLQINWFSRQAFQQIETWFKDDLKYLPSLQTIAFHNCEDLEALPDWICNLSSLQHLRVYDCINLASLPEGMLNLTNLQTLEIIGCPILVEECQTQTGETWDKTAHVPKIILSSLH
ncbi:disease resistance protein (TIR-NBS-LRR class), putative [Medicago truncatula]|nr:disease resistance protein (TIR-NBS-LRR class), putative [Medicago truncatula]